MFKFLCKKEIENLENKLKNIYKFFGYNYVSEDKGQPYISFGQYKIFIKSNELNNNELKPIDEYVFPEVVLKRTKEELNLNDKELNLVKLDFFDYMLVIKEYGKEIDMLNKQTDVLWHNLILDTRSYIDFCINHMGRFIHHKPFLNDKVLTKDEKIQLYKKYSYAIENNYDYLRRRKEIIQENKSTSDYSSSSFGNNNNLLLNLLVLDALTDFDTNERLKENIQQEKDDASKVATTQSSFNSSNSSDETYKDSTSSTKYSSDNYSSYDSGSGYSSGSSYSNCSSSSSCSGGSSGCGGGG